jgi:hypothetical protein
LRLKRYLRPGDRNPLKPLILALVRMETAKISAREKPYP